MIIDDSIHGHFENESAEYYKPQLLSSMQNPWYIRRLLGFPFFYVTAEKDIMDSIGNCTFEGDRSGLLGNTFNNYDDENMEIPFYIWKPSLKDLDNVALDSNLIPKGSV